MRKPILTFLAVTPWSVAVRRALAQPAAAAGVPASGDVAAASGLAGSGAGAAARAAAGVVAGRDRATGRAHGRGGGRRRLAAELAGGLLGRAGGDLARGLRVVGPVAVVAGRADRDEAGDQQRGAGDGQDTGTDGGPAEGLQPASRTNSPRKHRQQIRRRSTGSLPT